MLSKYGPVLILVSVAAVASSCRDAPATDSAPAASGAVEQASPETLPLKEIMSGLEGDLEDVAHGIWVEDGDIIAAGATRIADHPRVPPEQMGRIQEALGEEFTAFVQMDGRVHDGAVDLAAAADSAQAIPDLFQAYVDIQNGCMSCHMAFRDRVSGALAAAASAG